MLMDDVPIELFGGPLDGEILTGYSPDRPIYSYALAPKGMLHKYERVDAPAGGPVRYVYRGVVESEKVLRGD